MEFIKLSKKWKISNLGDNNIADLIMGQSPPSSTYNNKGMGLPFLQGKAEFGEMYPKPTIACSVPVKIAEKNDILLSVRAPVGDVNINPFKSCIGRGLAAIRTKSDKLDFIFLFYYLKYTKKLFESLSSGSTFKSITKKEVEKFQILLPSVIEQEKIAEILLSVDESIKEVNRTIAKTEKLKNGLMHKLLRNGIGHKEFKDTEIGKIPKHWHITKLGNIIKQKKETVSPCSIKTTKYIGLEHIDSGNCKIKRWGNSSEVKSIKFQFKAGDILYGKLRPYLNKAAIAEWSGVCSTDILVFEAKNRINNIFILYLIHHPNTLRYAITTSTGTNHPRTSWRMLSKLKIPLPLLLEQNKIAEILSTVDERIQLLKEKKNKLKRIKKGLMNDLFSGEKRVKLEILS